jgi:hypothetical protein
VLTGSGSVGGSIAIETEVCHSQAGSISLASERGENFDVHGTVGRFLSSATQAFMESGAFFSQRVRRFVSEGLSLSPLTAAILLETCISKVVLALGLLVRLCRYDLS